MIHPRRVKGRSGMMKEIQERFAKKGDQVAAEFDGLDDRPEPGGQRRRGVRMPWWVGVVFLVGLPTGVVWLAPATLYPAWMVMWLLAFAIYCGCKGLSLTGFELLETLGTRGMFYACAWPGLDAKGFIEGKAEGEVTGREWGMAIFKTGLGLAEVYLIARLVPAEMPYLRGWVGMVGTITVLHFGVFHVMSCAYRSRGINARVLMDAPGYSRSLGEFWGRRWNTAFRDLAYRFLFKPLSGWLGMFWGLWAGFLVSGLVHDVVISYPAGGGYGGPTAYFLIQAAGVSVEKSRVGRRLGLGRGWRGWTFTMLVLVAPAGILFHPPFVERVFVPFMRAIGAL